jgi:peptidoglycan/xylan/chitin deacetylase (PgdA/CDA1 family)
MYREIKPYLSKLNFLIGNNPKIEQIKNWREFIPAQFKSVLLISADFELAWAWRYTKSASHPLEKALRKARQERINIHLILDLCDKYQIPITWATVGHLFLGSCQRENNIPHPEIPRLPYFENNFWKYNGGDWFENDPCTYYKDAPEWYCPDLIKLIRDAKAKHEIGCHTFSHIDSSDKICPPDLFQAELKECKKLANEWGIILKSFVHPGYTIGNVDMLAKEGFTNYRSNNRNVLGYPKKHKNGLWEIEQTAEFIYKKEWSIDYHVYRYITILKRAIKSNTVCIFWFHPSFNSIIIEKIWPEIFQFIEENREKILVTTHTEYINWLNNKWKQ